MNLPTKCWHFSPYGFRGKNTWIWVLAFSHSSQWKSSFRVKMSHYRHLWRPLWVELEMLRAICWEHDPRRVIQISCWFDRSCEICGVFREIGSSPPTSEPYYGRTVWTIGMSLEYVYRLGPETMCTDFWEIWTKSVGTGAKSVFWRKFKMAENLSRRKWAWPIWGDASWPKESRAKGILIFRHTVRELWSKT